MPLRRFVSDTVNRSRRFLPLRIIVGIVVLRAFLAARRPAVWEDARAQMRFVVGDDQPDEVIDGLAAGYLKRELWLGEARWRPSLLTGQSVDGVHHLHELVAQGTGFVINTMHHGNWEGVFGALAEFGLTSHVVATSEMFTSSMPGWMRQQARLVTDSGCTLIDVADGMPSIRAVLAQGLPVTIATDVPGSTRVSFLGRELSMASGAAVAAFTAQVPVVVITASPDPARGPWKTRLEVSDPIYPAGFESPRDLLQAMVRVHEKSWAAWPDGADDPLRILNWKN